MSITFEQLQKRLDWMIIRESEWHQHPKGGGWVQNTATVSETATVEGIVYGNAQVYGDARVYGDAWGFSPLQIQGSMHFVTTCTHTHIQIGCQHYTVREWLSNYRQIGKYNGYTADQIEEYGLILTLCAEWLKAKFRQAKPIRDAKGRFIKRGEVA